MQHQLNDGERDAPNVNKDPTIYLEWNDSFQPKMYEYPPKEAF